MRLLTQNAKMKKTSNITGLKTFNFSLPAIKTCPFAGECKKYCYASKGFFCIPSVQLKHNFNLAISKTRDFELYIFDEIIINQIEVVRIHDTGDLYSKEYLAKWINIANGLPHVKFYAYTKSIPYFTDIKLPENFTVIYSFGGIHDDLINIDKDRHCKVFKDFVPNDYAYASDNDHIALSHNKKIGLILH